MQRPPNLLQLRRERLMIEQRKRFRQAVPTPGDFIEVKHCVSLNTLQVLPDRTATYAECLPQFTPRLKAPILKQR